MSRSIPVKPPTLENMQFGDSLAVGDNQLMAVMAGGKASEAVAMAASLSDGMRGLLRHMHASTDAGELVFCSEIKTLAFISDAVLALTRSAELAFSGAEKESAQ